MTADDLAARLEALGRELESPTVIAAAARIRELEEDHD